MEQPYRRTRRRLFCFKRTAAGYLHRRHPYHRLAFKPRQTAVSRRDRPDIQRPQPLPWRRSLLQSDKPENSLTIRFMRRNGRICGKRTRRTDSAHAPVCGTARTLLPDKRWHLWLLFRWKNWKTHRQRPAWRQNNPAAAVRIVPDWTASDRSHARNDSKRGTRCRWNTHTYRFCHRSRRHRLRLLGDEPPCQRSAGNTFHIAG